MCRSLGKRFGKRLRNRAYAPTAEKFRAVTSEALKTVVPFDTFI